MRSLHTAVFLVASVTILAGSANASLIGVDPLTPGGTDYQAVYDSDQNITWLANANLAASNSFGVSGITSGTGVMSWYTAHTWIDAMNSAGYLGVSTWRLPYTIQPDPNCSLDDGLGNGYGTGCTASEMAHLDVVEGITRASPGLFTRIPAAGYWSDTAYAPHAAYAWLFSFSLNSQNYSGAIDTRLAWAVTTGNPFNAVPVPATAWLFGSALGLLGVRRRLS